MSRPTRAVCGGPRFLTTSAIAIGGHADTEGRTTVVQESVLLGKFKNCDLVEVLDFTWLLPPPIRAAELETSFCPTVSSIPEPWGFFFSIAPSFNSGFGWCTARFGKLLGEISCAGSPLRLSPLLLKKFHPLEGCYWVCSYLICGRNMDWSVKRDGVVDRSYVLVALCVLCFKRFVSWERSISC